MLIPEALKEDIIQMLSIDLNASDQSSSEEGHDAGDDFTSFHYSESNGASSQNRSVSRKSKCSFDSVSNSSEEEKELLKQILAKSAKRNTDPSPDQVKNLQVETKHNHQHSSSSS